MNWSGGQYSVDRARIRMETRTGVALYETRLYGKSLTFVTRSGLVARYRRTDIGSGSEAAGAAATELIEETHLRQQPLERSN